ncbi:MAG: DUF488 domain-containing protein [Archaeoglobaceae archaeon]
MSTNNEELLVFTIGHSTRSLEELVELLKAHDIQEVIDVRTLPGSKHNPQFNKEGLAEFLKKHKIDYVHMKSLGGLRKPSKDSVNTGWKASSFRGFADYMQTSKFLSAIETLIEIAKNKRLALMCAEAVPWRCHRNLIADALVVRNVRVEHIISASEVKDHKMTSFARVDNTSITYPES